VNERHDRARILHARPSFIGPGSGEQESRNLGGVLRSVLVRMRDTIIEKTLFAPGWVILASNQHERLHLRCMLRRVAPRPGESWLPRQSGTHRLPGTPPPPPPPTPAAEAGTPPPPPAAADAGRCRPIVERGGAIVTQSLRAAVVGDRGGVGVTAAGAYSPPSPQPRGSGARWCCGSPCRQPSRRLCGWTVKPLRGRRLPPPPWPASSSSGLPRLQR